jgi:hypothetical protein
MTERTKFRNGFIHSAVREVVLLFRWVSLMEYFKLWAAKLSGESEASSKRHTYVSNAVDLYTTLKWLTIAMLWWWGAVNWFTLVISWYLIVTNLHTFVYYFLWKSDGEVDHERSKKRFVKLILAIFFSDFCFAYLFATRYHAQFAWESGYNPVEQAAWYSISNSVAGNYDKVKPATENGYTLMMVQYMITFFYVGVLISKAIPQKTTA